MLTDRIVMLSWAAFCGVWAVSSRIAKASVGERRWVRWYQPVRFMVPAVLLVYIALFAQQLPPHGSPATAIGILGAILCALGIAFAIWARASIGDNWGMPMTQRKTPQLVTRGPYAYLRHPIYTGVLLGMMGTMVVANPRALVMWPITCTYLCVSALKEERDMLRLFPDDYRDYMSRTKRLVPFVW